MLHRSLCLWIETILGVVSAIALILTLIIPNWIERFFATFIIPNWIERFFAFELDGGDGSTEWGLVALFGHRNVSLVL